jgi:hypothetical protein
MSKSLEQLKAEFLLDGAPAKRPRKACELFALGDEVAMSADHPDVDTTDYRYGRVVAFGKSPGLLVVESLGKRLTWHMAFWTKFNLKAESGQ